LGRKNYKINLPNSFNIEYKSVSDKTEIGDAFKKKIVNIGYKVNHNIAIVNRNFISYLPNNAQSMFLEPIISGHNINKEIETKN